MSIGSEALESFVRWVMRDVTYHKHYLCTVQGQSGETLDLRPDDDSIRGDGLSKVPIMHGLPGVSVKVAPGTKVTLFFENGDPQKPRAIGWEGSHIEVSFANGTLPVARVGDTVTIPGTGLTGYLGTPILGVATGTIAAGAPTVKA